VARMQFLKQVFVVVKNGTSYQQNYGSAKPKKVETIFSFYTVRVERSYIFVRAAMLVLNVHLNPSE
jgi:hypothetical protein